MMSDTAKPFLKPADLALAARHEIISMTSAAKASHVASALSVVDILSVLYCGAANISPENMDAADRDIVKGFFQKNGSPSIARTMRHLVVT